MRDGDGEKPDEELRDALEPLLERLPTELEPERDLLPEIAARAWRRQEASQPAGPDQKTLLEWWSLSRGLRARLAAAAIAVLVVTSILAAIVTGILGDGGEPLRQAGSGDLPAGAGTAPGSPATARSDPLQAQYSQAINELLTALEARQEELTPETRRLIQENLRIIDAALSEAIAALAGTPGDAGLRQAVVLTYEQKLGFLRQATALTVKSSI